MANEETKSTMATATTSKPQSSQATTKRDGKESEKEVPETKSVVLNSEFIYFSSVLRMYAPVLSKQSDQITTRMWVKKLFSPEYHTKLLKPKRNRYLASLAITLYNDETHGIFECQPPTGGLPEIDMLPPPKEVPPASWEDDLQWKETLEDMREEWAGKKCTAHGNQCPQGDSNIVSLLDTEFQYYLWLSRPYVSLMTSIEDKTKAALWIQKLCCLAPMEDDCPDMKGLRNDYMKALLGYIHDLRVAGPFSHFPPEDQLPSLADAAKETKTSENFSDPSGEKAEEFLTKQPIPKEGAFAYISINGDLLNSIS